MKISVIIPNHKSDDTLPRTLESVRVASDGLDTEIIVSSDPDGNGPSWARNRGLDRATGDFIFFIDADDTVKPDFFKRLLSVLESEDSDFVISSFDYAPLKRDYNLTGNDSIRKALLPAFFGYSFEDVRRWNEGGNIYALREHGSVWRCAFRRDFIEKHHVRFDEALRFYEDSPFIAECACYAEKVSSIPDILYEYVPGAHGVMSASLKDGKYWDYKFTAYANRVAMNQRVGGNIWTYFEASCVFTALEFLKAGRFSDLRRYIHLPHVAEAIHSFPLSHRHPLVAMCVVVLRCNCLPIT